MGKPSSEHLQILSLALIREFLSRKGLHETLKCLDKESPRNEHSINSRTTLARELCIDYLMYKNREQKRPLRTIIEVIVKHLINTLKSVCTARKLIKSESISHMVIVKKNDTHVDIITPEEHTCICDLMPHKDVVFPNVSNVIINKELKNISKHFLHRRSKSVIDMRFLVGMEHYAMSLDSMTSFSGRSSKTQKDDDEQSSVTTSGTVKSTEILTRPKSPESAESILRAKEQILLSSLSQGQYNNHFHDGDNSERLGPNKINTFHDLKDINGTQEEQSESGSVTSAMEFSPSHNNVIHGCGSQTSVCDVTKEDSEVDSINNNNKNIAKCIPKLIVSSPELDILDIEEELMEVDEIPIGVSPMTLPTAVHLKKILLGSSSEEFSPQWMDQGFVFNNHINMGYGLLQKSGGPCGVLATVQGFVLKNLLFEKGVCSRVDPLRPTKKESSKALVLALRDVLWQAGDSIKAVLALPSSEIHLSDCGRYRQDGLTECLDVVKIESRNVLEDTLRQHLDTFTGEDSHGCLLFVISAILSRGIQSVREDMDDPVPLIAPNGHCIQELVNLLLTGRAVSNVFDNNLYLDTCLLRGVSSRADVGFLSLFEYYNSCQVGTYLKTPRYPVWIVCSENHFTVLFSCKKELISDWRAEKRFHLYHYDCLGRQEDEVKLTVDTTGIYPSKPIDKDHTPPLEHCIRTKWKDAIIDWNEYEPVLWR